MALSKGVKWGLGIGLFVLLGIALYYIFRTPVKTVSWKEYPGGDISGTQYDIARETFTTLDDAKARAIALNAKSFLVNGTTVIFKNASAPIQTVAGGAFTLYVKQ